MRMTKAAWLVLLALTGALAACDSGSPSGGALNYPDVTIGDSEPLSEVSLPDEDASESPVPVSVGLDVRLVWHCGDKDVTGYNYNPSLMVTAYEPSGEDPTLEEGLAEYHQTVQSNGVDDYDVGNLYKGASEWDPYDNPDNNMDPCYPDSGVTAKSYTLPYVPQDPDTYVVTVSGWSALNKPAWQGGYDLYVPDAGVTVEVYCSGEKVYSVSVNPVEDSLPIHTALDVALVHTLPGGQCDVTPLEKSVWCPLPYGCDG
jgi:hypothetical protein